MTNSTIDQLPTPEALQAMDKGQREAVAAALASLQMPDPSPEPPHTLSPEQREAAACDMVSAEPMKKLELTAEQVNKVAALADALDWRWFSRVAANLPAVLADAAWDRVYDKPKQAEIERVLAYRDELQARNPTTKLPAFHETEML